VKRPASRPVESRFDKVVPERRAVILGAIVAEIAEHGFAAASVAGIAARAGTSKASLFYYFADRDEMLAAAVGAVLGEVLGSAEDGLPALPQATTPGAFWAAFEAIYRGMAERLASDPVRARFARAWLGVLDREDIPGALQPFVERTRGLIDAMVTAGLSCGALRSDIPRPLLVRVLFATAIAVDTWMAEEVARGTPVDAAVRPVLALVRSAFGAGGEDNVNS
jgi:AcrR family transcriptional regulator